MVSDGRAARRTGDRFHGRMGWREEPCAIPGCAEPGEFRSPDPAGKRPGFDGPGEWRWLCLDHVREFNAGYNYFTGMSPEEIEAEQRPYAGWERETRAFSANPDTGPRWGDFADPLDAIAARFRRDAPDDLRPRKDGRPLSPGERKALRTLELPVDVERRALRERYAELVRRYHPDRNGGDRSHEKALSEVIAAYQLLKGAAAFA